VKSRLSGRATCGLSELGFCPFPRKIMLYLFLIAMEFRWHAEDEPIPVLRTWLLWMFNLTPWRIYRQEGENNNIFAGRDRQIKGLDAEIGADEARGDVQF
jgi:hypothetical protein